MIAIYPALKDSRGQSDEPLLKVSCISIRSVKSKLEQMIPWHIHVKNAD
jgi:hypothetical protein